MRQRRAIKRERDGSNYLETLVLFVTINAKFLQMFGSDISSMGRLSDVVQ